MNLWFKSALHFFYSRFERKEQRRLFYLIVILLIAMGEYTIRGMVRRDFVFFSILDHKVVVENRMIPKGNSKEVDIRRYIEEVLGGPISLDLGPLLNRGTTLDSLLLRDSVVYANFSSQGALPPLEGNQNLFQNLSVLNEGICRNFPYIKENHFFIGGNEAFFEKFRAMGRDRQKNSEKGIDK